METTKPAAPPSPPPAAPELQQALEADSAKTLADQRAAEAKSVPVSEAQAKERGQPWPPKP